MIGDWMSLLLGVYLGGFLTTLFMMTIVKKQSLVQKWAMILSMIIMSVFWPATLFAISRRMNSVVR